MRGNWLFPSFQSLVKVTKMVLLREAARIFNSKELAAFAEGDPEFLLKVASRYKDELGNFFSARDVFDFCYNDFRLNYRNEYFIKSLIVQKILLGRHSLNTATMINEFRAGLSKADCVVLNGASTCYEIKSEYDSLARLPEQLTSYLKLFDRVYVVTPEKHLKKVMECLPCGVGVLKLSRRNTLSEYVEAKSSSQPVDVDVLMDSLRKNEYLMLVEYFFGSVPDVASGAIYDACKDLLSSVDSASLRKAFCDVLKRTRFVDGDFLSSLPGSLLAAGVEYCFTSASKAALVDNLDIKFSKDALCTIPYSEVNVMS